MIKKLGNTFLIALGLISLALGLIGMFLPLLPTTPFVLLAAYFFSKGSPKLHHWVISRPYFGPMILEWERHGIISIKAKILATTMIILLFGLTLKFVNVSMEIKTLVTFIGLCVLLFILSRPSHSKDDQPPNLERF